MATNATLGSQTLFQIGTTASPPVYTTIGEIRSIGDIGEENDLIEVTHLQSVGKEYIGGLPDGVAFSIVVNFDPANTAQLAALAAVATKTVRPFKMVMLTSPTYTFTFYALVTGWRMPVGPNDANQMTFNLKISGGITKG